MKKIFNNGLRVFNTAMFMTAVVATTLFASCSKDSVNQNDPVSAVQEKHDTEKTAAKEKTPTRLRVYTKFTMSKGLEDYLDLKVTTKGTNGEELQNLRSNPFKKFDNGTTSYVYYYDNKTMPGETSAKVDITLKDKAAKLPEGGLDVTIGYRFGYSFMDDTEIPIKNGGPQTTTKSQTIHVDTPEQLQEAVKTILSAANLDKVQTFKFDTKLNMTQGVAQQ